MKTIEEINQKINDQNVVVVTALEMSEIVDDIGVQKAAKEVDVVTTGTFGAMCSSGAILNFGHSDPPIKMSKTILNGVEAYSGLAAVDAYLGAGQVNTDPYIMENYGGAHVIEDLIAGKEIELKTEAYGTDCYPLKKLNTKITIDDLNQAIMFNPRNCYQNYSAATNSTDEIIKTYMGTLLPNMGNVTFSSAGGLSPLLNDPYFETIGPGSNIFLCGTEGHIVQEGTQHETDVERYKDVPTTGAGTLMVMGDMKKMDPKYVHAAAMQQYGSTLYVGIGIPIPILNENLARYTAIKDEDIICDIVDYGTPKRSRPTIKRTNYKELRSGSIEIEGNKVPTSALSSYKKSIEISEILKKWIERNNFQLSKPTRRLKSSGCVQKPLNKKTIIVKDIIPTKELVIVKINDSLQDVANKLVKNSINHIPIISDDYTLLGIVTSWDIARAVANNITELSKVMSSNVITGSENESLAAVGRRLNKNDISAIPIVDENNRIKKILTVEDISRIYLKKNK